MYLRLHIGLSAPCAHLCLHFTFGWDSGNQRGSGAAMKIFTFLNNRVITNGDLDNFHDQYEHVGVVQTAINPDDRTKPEGFR